jgi:predicted dithiol-disulfide oxidoreductase (DUF899 family)
MPKIKTVRGIENRKVVSKKEWLVVRKKLLTDEKRFTKSTHPMSVQLLPPELEFVNAQFFDAKFQCGMRQAEPLGCSFRT